MKLLLLSQMEEERRKHEPPTETERLQASANGHTRNRADDLLTEQRDEVKHMNQMGAVQQMCHHQVSAH